jgi:hypothetical protein
MVGKPEGKPSSGCRYNIKTDPTGIRLNGVDCVNLAYDRGIRDLCAGLWWGNLKENLVVDADIILKQILQEQD